MDQQTFRQAILLLSGEHSVSILRALRESHGAGVAVSESEIVQGVKDASATEGLFMAPEGGAAARRQGINAARGSAESLYGRGWPASCSGRCLTIT